MFTLTKEFAFEAAHHLTLVPDDHQCKRVHGHSYRVQFELIGKKLNAYGFVRDYHDLDPIAKWIKEAIDHQDLNELPFFWKADADTAVHETTAENLAKGFFEIWKPSFPELVAVRVSETVKTWAEWRPLWGKNGSDI